MLQNQKMLMHSPKFWLNWNGSKQSSIPGHSNRDYHKLRQLGSILEPEDLHKDISRTISKGKRLQKRFQLLQLSLSVVLHSKNNPTQSLFMDIWETTDHTCVDKPWVCFSTRSLKDSRVTNVFKGLGKSIGMSASGLTLLYQFVHTVPSGVPLNCHCLSLSEIVQQLHHMPHPVYEILDSLVLCIPVCVGLEFTAASKLTQNGCQSSREREREREWASQTYR